MPIRKRPSSRSLVFHVINRGNDHQKLFRSTVDFIFFHELVERMKARYKVMLYYYVFMPNHIHLIVEMKRFEDMSRFMHDLSFIYARFYHKQYESDGHVWTGRFKSKNIEKDAYLKQCGEYIEMNPVRAGLVTKPEDYPWSSARAHICHMLDSIVDPCPYIDAG
jgi:putative transposase